MKRHVLFVHGAGQQGHLAGEALAAYVQQALGSGFQVHVPAMPEPENPSYASWREQLVQELSALPDGVILIGHSLGGSVLLKYLSEERCDVRIDGLFVIAAPYWGADDDWQSAEYALPADFAAQVRRIPRLFFYHSRDDQVVPVEHLHVYAETLPFAVVRELDGRGHDFRSGLPEVVADLSRL